MMSEKLLEVKRLHVNYGAIEAIKGIDLHVNKGEVVTILGANGAGKTTTLRTISGLLKPSSGSIFFDGKEITQLPAHEIVSLGMSHSPEGRRVFGTLSVEENLMMGAYSLKTFDAPTLEWIYEILPRWLPDISDRARSISRTEARRLILDQYIHNVIASPLDSVARLFGWKLDDTQQIAAGLAAQGRVELDVKVAGIKELQIVAM